MNSEVSISGVQSFDPTDRTRQQDHEGLVVDKQDGLPPGLPAKSPFASVARSDSPNSVRYT